MITSLLIANRGEIASRVIRTARRMDIRTIALYSDADAEAPHVREADEAVRLPGVTPADTYLRADLVLEAARASGADAIHPGYGFLSENADFARACAEAGIVFVGPGPQAIDSMGSKTHAKDLMRAAGVPVLEGAVLNEGASREDLLAAADGLQFPVLVKAAYGGGGRGMRIVTAADELPEAVASAQREAQSAFGDPTVFLEHYVESPRHIEVQVFADTHGHVVHLFERECSIQRRYQKIIEEAPSVAVDEELRQRLGDAAVEAARAIGYVGAGTVEFVMGPNGDFWFLEVNTRLQVEHPVTEMITGTDLVEAQLLVAEGQPLPEPLLNARIDGHAIEVRLYAEDATDGFRPTPGVVNALVLPSGPGVRVDAGIDADSVVSQHYDPMLAKIITHAPTRELARRAMARALLETRVDGLTTNRDLLLGIMREPEFAAGMIDTGYLTRHDPAELSSSLTPQLLGEHLVALTVIEAGERRADRRHLPGVPVGWHNVAPPPSFAEYRCGDQEHRIEYRFDPHDQMRAEAWVDGTSHRVVFHRELGDLTIDGIRRGYTVTRHGPEAVVASARGSVAVTDVERFPEPGSSEAAGSLVAAMPGTVVKVDVEPGDRVSRGDLVVTLEAMKMEHAIRAPHDGRVASVGAQPGDVVDAGVVLAVIDEDEALSDE